MAKKKSDKTEAKTLAEQLKKVEKSFSAMIKSNEKLKKELDRMKELMSYVPGSSSKK